MGLSFEIENVDEIDRLIGVVIVKSAATILIHTSNRNRVYVAFKKEEYDAPMNCPDCYCIKYILFSSTTPPSLVGRTGKICLSLRHLPR